MQAKKENEDYKLRILYKQVREQATKSKIIASAAKSYLLKNKDDFDPTTYDLYVTAKNDATKNVKIMRSIKRQIAQNSVAKKSRTSNFTILRCPTCAAIHVPYGPVSYCSSCGQKVIWYEEKD